LKRAQGVRNLYITFVNFFAFFVLKVQLKIEPILRLLNLQLQVGKIIFVLKTRYVVRCVVNFYSAGFVAYVRSQKKKKYNFSYFVGNKLLKVV
jgi:hypothetical protein